MHPAAAVASTLAIIPLSVTMPVFGFAMLTAAVAFQGYASHGASKLRAERSFFAAGDTAAATIRIRSASIVGASLRALGVGALALFLFPPLDAHKTVQGGSLGRYAQQMEAERLPTLVIVFLTIALCAVGTAFFARAIKARATRWSLYRLGLVFGLVFSAITMVGNAQSDRIVSVLPEASVNGPVTLYEPPATLALLDAVRRLHQDLRQAERKRAGLDQRSRACARKYWIDAYGLRDRLNRAAWQCSTHRTTIDPVPIAQTTILTMAVFDDLIDGLLSELLESAIGIFAGADVEDDDKGPPIISVLGRIVLSSNLLQGFVLAVYIAPLAGTLQTAIRRPRFDR